MSTCCSGYACDSSSHFGPERAAADLARYRKKGPDPTTRLLAEAVLQEAGDIRDLLDVGGGIGALTFTILDRTRATAVLVEASSAFLEVARQEAERRQLGGRVGFAEGDFVERAQELQSADLVAMDRVVCCYSSADSLLEAGLTQAKRYFAFSYPRERWHVRAITALENLQRRLKHNPFRTYVHPVAGMRAILQRRGFDLLGMRLTFSWAIEVWRRIG